MRRMLVLAAAVLMVVAVAAPAMAAGNGQAGKSNVYQCDLEPGEAWDGYSYGKVTIKTFDDGYRYVVRVHGLTPGTGYEVRSGGAFDPAAEAVANDDGDALFKGFVDDIGAYFNVWIEPATSTAAHRILRTAEGCVPS